MTASTKRSERYIQIYNRKLGNQKEINYPHPSASSEQGHKGLNLNLAKKKISQMKAGETQRATEGRSED